LRKNSKRLKPQEIQLEQIKIKYKKPLKGEITPPPDKSISHRAVIITSIAEGKSTIKNFLRADDPIRTLSAFRKMGVEIKELKTQNTERRIQTQDLEIHSKGIKSLKKPKDIIDCGNSGTTMRLLSGVLAGQDFSSILSGDASLMQRPMQRIITPLSMMGASITSREGGYPPLTIKGGRLKPIDYQSPIASAQVKSAILLAGLYCEGVTSVSEPEKSRDHTERMLKAAGGDIKEEGLKVSISGKAHLNPLNVTIPGDFSSAAFFIVAGTIIEKSEILIKNVGVNPLRTGLLNILEKMGAKIRLINKREVSGEPMADIYVQHSELQGIKVSGDMIVKSIDEFPILCIAASLSKGTTEIRGAGELRVKESDRIASMAMELKKIGVEVEELKDGLIIHGGSMFKPAIVESHGDHRVAMSLAIAGLVSPREITVKDIKCISTSFPEFMSLINTLIK
jgi:3-phosphoshikimate 1-carboxyvinyltransferase